MVKFFICPAGAAPIKVQMPALSPTMEEGNIVKWLKKEGECEPVAFITITMNQCLSSNNMVHSAQVYASSVLPQMEGPSGATFRNTIRNCKLFLFLISLFHFVPFKRD